MIATQVCFSRTNRACKQPVPWVGRSCASHLPGVCARVSGAFEEDEGRRGSERGLRRRGVFPQKGGAEAVVVSVPDRVEFWWCQCFKYCLRNISICLGLQTRRC